MAGSVNKVILVGNLGSDPEVKSFTNGGRIAVFRVASSESWKDRQSGERKERTEWHSVTIASDGLVGVAERYLRKGSKVYIEGQLRTRKWQDQSGNDRYTTEVTVGGHGGVLTMLDSKPDGQQGGDRGDWGGGQQRSRSNDRGGRAGGGNDRWADGSTGDRNVYDGNRGGWQDGQGGGGSGDSWGGGFGDDLDDDIPF